MALTPEFWWFGVTEGPNGRRSAWRLKVRMPDVNDSPAMFRWLRDFVIPACLNAPFRVTLELEPPDDVVPPDDPSF